MHQVQHTLMPRKCPCFWGADCSNFERILAAKGNRRYRRGNTGRIRITHNPNSDKNVALRAAIRFHFGLPPKDTGEEYCIARHHFHPELLDYLLDDEGFNLKVKMTTPLPASIAHDIGICSELNMFALSPDENASSNRSSIDGASSESASLPAAKTSCWTMQYMHALSRISRPTMKSTQAYFLYPHLTLLSATSRTKGRGKVAPSAQRSKELDKKIEEGICDKHVKRTVLVVANIFARHFHW